MIWTNVDGAERVIFDHDIEEAGLQFNSNYQEIVSNPALAAAFSGAPAKEWRDLPGEQVATLHSGTDVVLTYKVRFRLPGTGLSEFRPRW